MGNKSFTSLISKRIILMVSVLVMVFGLASLVIIRNTVEKEISLRLDSENNFAAKRIESLFSEALIEVNRLNSNKSILTYLSEIKTREDITSHPLYEDVLTALKTAVVADKQLYLIAVVSKYVDFYMDDKGYISNTDYSIYKRPWYEKASQAEGVIFSDPYIDAGESYVEEGIEHMVVACFDPIRIQGELIGFNVANFRLDVLPEIISDVNIGSHGEIFIINAQNQLIYAKEKDRILRPIEDDTNSPSYNIWQGTRKIKDSSGIVSIKGETYVIRQEAIEHTDWLLISAISLDEAMTKANFYLAGAGLVIAIVGVIFILGIRKVIVYSTKPISAINDYGQKVAEGIQDAEPPTEFTERKDEFGQLMRSFIVINDAFQKQKQYLEEIVSSQHDEIRQQYRYILDREKMASLGTLVSGVAHEINTPLGTSITYATFVEKRLRELHDLFQSQKLSKSGFERNMDEAIQGCEAMIQNLSRVTELVETFKGIVYNHKSKKMGWFDLKDELETVIVTFGEQLDHLSVKVDHAFPSVDVFGYRNVFIQIFTHLIMNSLDHGFMDESDNLISIKIHKDGDLIRIAYKDNGKGIDKVLLDKIYDPFYTTRSQSDNSGLGLYIIYNLVTQVLSGTIKCSSEVDQGVDIQIVIPRILESQGDII